jgi:hypothetical protein
MNLEVKVQVKVVKIKGKNYRVHLSMASGCAVIARRAAPKQSLGSMLRIMGLLRSLRSLAKT